MSSFIQDYKPIPFPISKGEHFDENVELLSIKEAHEHYQGQGTKIMFIDTGIQSNHKDLNEDQIVVKDFVNTELGNGADRTGHGTHVAGIVLAKGGRQSVRGIAPKTTAYIAKVVEEREKGSQKRLIEALQWAIDENVQVINMSFGTPKPFDVDTYDKIKEVYAKGIIMVAAAGNDNYNINYPAKYPEVIAVGSISKDNIKTGFSNHGKEVEIMAPGEKVLSLFPYNKYAKMSGTSMSVPIVSGAILLYMQKIKKDTGNWPTLDEVRIALSESVKDIGKIGRDPYYGYGKIDLIALLAL